MTGPVPYSRFVLARPSAAEGVARILDFANALTCPNDLRTAGGADALALHADWCAVGEDLAAAMRGVSKRLPPHGGKEKGEG